VERPGAAPRFSAEEILLGTGVLNHLEVAVGPTELSVGVCDLFQVGTYLPPYLVTLLDAGNAMPNLAFKGRLFTVGPMSVGAAVTFFYVQLERFDRSKLGLRAWVVPARLIAEVAWLPDWTTTLELTTVWMELNGTVRLPRHVVLRGAGAGQSTHLSLVQRYRLADRWSVWARARVSFDRAPVVMHGQTVAAGDVRLRVRAQGELARGASGITGVGGVSWTYDNFNLLVGAGYGTLFIPWLELPVGLDTFAWELSATWRF